MNREGWTLRNYLWVPGNLRERNLNSLFKLRIASGDYVRRSDLNIEIRCDAKILYTPTRSTWIVGRAIRQTNRASINERRSKVVGANAATEGALTNEWTNLRKFEHERTRFCRRPVQFVDDHHLNWWCRIYRRSNIVTTTKHVVVERLALHPFDQVIGCDTATIETLID